MANEQNLIPTSKRTKSEAREISKKGGIASGQARRKKKEFAAIIEQALSTELPNKDAQKKLEVLGFEPTFQAAIALKVVELATKGNLRAVEVLTDLTANKKDSLDRKEQRERIKAIQLENEKRKNALGGGKSTEDTMSEFFEKLEKEVSNGIE